MPVQTPSPNRSSRPQGKASPTQAAAGARPDGAVLAADPDWWRGAVIYQIYPRSFFDTDGNGVGDLAGITEKLDAVADLGADAIWISPFFRSPMEDFGYDVSDYCDVDPLFGDLDAFRTLLGAAHDRGLRVLIDLVVSHTSDQHAWFRQSRASRTNPRADWYVWADPTPTGNPPNNWLSLFGGSAWEWEPRRGQYYLHNFLKSQPDLNFHTVAVQDAVLDTARFWLDMGVDGFRLDVVNFYFHDALLRDNPPARADANPVTVQPSNPYAMQEHLYDKHRPENLDFLERFRALLDAYPAVTTVGELGVDRDVAEATESYTLGGRRLHQVYSFELMTPTLSADHVRRVVDRMAAVVRTGWVSWAVSNHDFARIVSRWGLADRARDAGPLLIAMVASLRGSPCLYQGEELALTEAQIAFEDLQDPYGRAFWPEFKGRDGCRTPYPWRHDQPHGGFSQVKPWLPVPPEHLAVAYDLQTNDPDSALSRVRRFLHWRRTRPELIKGDFLMYGSDGPVLAFERRLGDARMLCAFNLDRAPQRLPLAALGPLAGFGPLTVDRGSGFDAEAVDEAVRLPGLGAAFCRVG